MKLNTKVIFNYIVISTILFAIGGVVLFNYVRKEVDEKVDWKLYADKQRIIDATEDTRSLQEKRSMYKTINLIAERNVEIEKIDSDVIFEDELKDTLLPTFLYGGNIYRPYRQLKFYTRADNQVYKITLRKLLVEKIDLREGIVNSLLYVFLALLIILIISNYFMSRRIWSPFYETVHQITQYDLAGSEFLQLTETGIKEFNVLNNAFNKMSEKIRKDFISLKEFTENASHEIQTPLAVIESKLELFIQSESLNNEQSANIQTMYEAVAKLSRLNQLLVLITKIENAQFANKKLINLNAEIEETIENLDDLKQAKNLRLEMDLSPEVILEMNKPLAEVLFSNLLANAIKHNVQDGNIIIKLTETGLEISNTGEPLAVEPEQLFKRFRKMQHSSESLGLGLSIVKSICDFYNMEINYTYRDKMHTINIKF